MRSFYLVAVYCSMSTCLIFEQINYTPDILWGVLTYPILEFLPLRPLGTDKLRYFPGKRR